ncbi:MAG: RhuM family protein, partial [bacterium]|nr:RhuM family protein [bacterium]
MKRRNVKNPVVVYQARSGAIELRGDLHKETIWASLDQIAALFERDKSVISRHIKNIFQEGELKRDSVVALFATTAADGKTYRVEYFNLDLVVSVGYRVNSKKATRFRQWATKILREHITRGYTINARALQANYAEFMQAVENIKLLLPEDGGVDAGSALELVKAFADTWVSLEAYDEDRLAASGTTKKAVALTAEQLSQALASFKS